MRPRFSTHALKLRRTFITGCTPTKGMGRSIPSHRMPGTPFQSFQKGCGIPSNRVRARCGNGRKDIFTPYAWNAQQKVQKGCGIPFGAYLRTGCMEPPIKPQNGFPRDRQTARGIPSYLHTYGKLKSLGPYLLYIPIGILVCKYGFG